MGFEGRDKTTSQDRTGEFFFRQHAGGGAHRAAGGRVGSERLKGVREGGDVARGDDDPAPVFLDEASQPARVAGWVAGWLLAARSGWPTGWLAS